MPAEGEGVSLLDYKPTKALHEQAPAKHETTIHVELRWREDDDGGRVNIKPDISWFTCSCGAVGDRIDDDRHEQPKTLRAAHTHVALSSK